MISEEAIFEGLSGLSVTAGMLVEDHIDELITIVPADYELLRSRMKRLQKLGADLLAISAAGLALLDN